ncbi:hypothetical protein AVEN_242451-1 [Araneus ventricosus]|uniref:Uncharacterized protein n=1 Tax=Araneus ventricosus TaxID=182803 RepID=A0A4Y2K7F8_ARAVE|nr:hypothetical protein AVEN_242451-1 [Araneus ventricosus]
MLAPMFPASSTPPVIANEETTGVAGKKTEGYKAGKVSLTKLEENQAMQLETGEVAIRYIRLTTGFDRVLLCLPLNVGDCELQDCGMFEVTLNTR